MSQKYPNMEKLDRLMDDAVDEILNMSDEEVLEEFGEDVENTDARIAVLENIVNEQVSIHRRSRLIAAREAIDMGKDAQVVPIRDMSRDQMLDSLVRVIEKHGNKDLTMAARDGNGMSDDDLASYLEDMRELGYFEEDDS